MELSFFTPLLKDGAESVSGGVAINNEGLLETGLSENGSGANGIDKSVKCSFVFVIPMKSATFGTMGDEGVEWGGEHTKVANVHAVKVEETEKGAELS
jgi:hypothetical protein